MSDSSTPLRPKRKKVLVDYLVQFRWILVIFVVLPISFTIYFLLYLGDMRSEMKSFKRRQEDHDENVAKVLNRLKKRTLKDGLVCTARKPYIAVGMRNVDYKRARHFEVDLAAFRNILEINKERMVARVEPLVNMGQITRVTVPMNLALAVVAELDDLTVGGLINGYGIEGSSHIYGLFSDTVVALEIVLADGRLVRATKDNEYSDLFYAVPWSQGTLGLLVAAEIKLIPIKEYMRLTYMPVRGNLQGIAQAYADSFAPRDGDPAKVPDFVEGMIYNPTEGVMMTGRYASKEEAKKKGNVINCVGWWFKPWFYQHAQTALKRGEFVEYIPTREYYHRHTRSLYWEGKLILPFGDQWWFRWTLGWLMPPKVSLLKFTQGEAVRNYYHENHVIQDMLVPLYKVGDALEWVHRYDQYGEEGLKAQVPPPGGAGSSTTTYFSPGNGPNMFRNADDIFKEFFGSSYPFDGMGGGGMRGGPRFNDGFGGIFGDDTMRTAFCGGTGSSMHNYQPMKAAPIENPLPCSLEDLYKGGTKKMKITREITDASGKTVTVEELVHIDIKPGWKKGTKITFSEKGNEQPNVIPADLIFIIDEKLHNFFTREGNDLVITQKISLAEALTGYTVNLTTLDGRILTIPITNIITPGYEEVVPREGMPVSKDPFRKGSLKIKFNVKFPSRLTAEQKAGLKKLLAP